MVRGVGSGFLALRCASLIEITGTDLTGESGTPCNATGCRDTEPGITPEISRADEVRAVELRGAIDGRRAGVSGGGNSVKR